MSDYTDMSDELQRRDVQQAFDRLRTEVQRLADTEQRRRLTLTLNMFRTQFEGKESPLRLVLSPKVKSRSSTAGCFAAADDLPPDGPPEAA